VPVQLNFMKIKVSNVSLAFSHVLNVPVEVAVLHVSKLTPLEKAVVALVNLDIIVMERMLIVFNVV